MSCDVVSVGVVTVEDMTSTRTHTCVYFDDGSLEHLCSCGSRALLVIDDEELGGVLLALRDEEPAAPTRLPSARAIEELAVSA